MKNKKWIAVAVLVLVLAVFSPFLVENIQVSNNNAKLKQSITSIERDTVSLWNVVPFEWEYVYTFRPYLSESEMEEIIGFESNHLEETVSEGMVQLVFVKDSKVVASVCGHRDNLGYSVDFPREDEPFARISPKDYAAFSVVKTDGVVELKFLEGRIIITGC